MLRSWYICAAVGALLGYMAGLGAGGGSLLILWLTFVLKTDTAAARCINLLFFLASAAAVCVLRIKKGELQLRAQLPAIVSGCIAAGISAWLSGYFDVTALRKPFGILLLAIGLKELFYRPRKLR